MQLLSQFGNLCAGCRYREFAGVGGHQVGLCRLARGWRRRAGLPQRRLLQQHQKQGRLQRGARAFAHRAHTQVDQRVVPVGFNVQAHHRHFLAQAHRLVQRGGQITAQAFAGHFQHIADTGLAWGRLQVHAGAPMQVKNVTMAIDQRRHGRELLQQGLLGEFTHGEFCQLHGLAIHGLMLQGVVKCRWQKPPQRGALRALKIFLALKHLGFAVQRGEQVTKLPHRF